MTSTEVHTPLEMLILFQTLQSPTTESPSFTRISESMKNNALIKESESFESARLEPDVLKELYLRVMKDEVKPEANGAGKLGTEKDGQQNPRKRKLSSPLLQTVDEAFQHAHLLPPLLDRLYFRYRDHAIRVIEDEERKYRLLQRDIQEINRGEWDARLQHQEISSKRDSNGVTSIQTLLRHDSDAENLESNGNQPIAKSPPRQPAKISVPATQPPTPPEKEQDEQKNVVAKSYKDSSEQTDRIGTEAETHPSVPNIPTIPQAPETLAPTSQPSSATGGPQQVSTISNSNSRSQPIPSDSNVTFLPSQQHTNPSYPLASPKLDVANRRLPYPPNQPVAGAASSVSPHINQPVRASRDRSPQSPIILPYPSAMLRSSGSPQGPLDTLADMAGQQFRHNTTLPSPRPAQTPLGQTPIQLPHPRNYPHPVYPYYDSQPAYGVAYPPYSQGHMPPYHHPSQAGPPAYQGVAPSPNRSQIYSNVPLYHSPSPSYSQYPAYPQQPQYHPTPVQNQLNRAQVPKFSDPRTPISGSSSKNRPPKPSPIDTSVSSTKWKNFDIPGSVKSPKSPTRPGSEEISPISERASSPIPEVPSHQSSAPRYLRGRKARGGSLRGNRSRGHRARAASAASSTIAASIQSPRESISTEGLDDELSIDNHNQPSNSKIKPEPPATPAGDEDVSITETTADEGSRKSTRHRRGTLRSLEMTEIGRTSTKRKRDEPQENPRPASPSFPTNRTNHILASRNFLRTSATVMNDVSAHKLASMFAKPLTERDAPGYKDLIYRPQDLKSIKSAIIAGGKAVVSATENQFTDGVGSPAQMGGGTPSAKGTNSTWIPATPDVVPPKGIVNSAQLEKELMRMFANAVMFNPDPKRGVGPAFRERKPRKHVSGTENDKNEGDKDDEDDLVQVEEDDGDVVTDTREMFEAVERNVGHWRAAERAAERTAEDLSSLGKARLVEKEEDVDMDELAGEGDVEEGTSRRRRR